MTRNFSKQDPIDENIKIGHVHLKVANIERALGFYCDVLGFHITQRYGDSAVFIAAGDYHHHIGLNTWESKDGSPPPLGTTGLYHTAILYPTRSSLADALRRLNTAGIELDGAADHGVSEAIYLRDPDNNGVELYWDKPRELWPTNAKGELQMHTRRLDLDSLLREIATDKNNQRMRLQALSRWENEGGSLSSSNDPALNPEEHAICNEYRQRG
jgi:catechol 2,3-dioxygenase